MTTLTGILIIASLYFLPTVVAATRKNHTAAIGALNLFLGWTLIGWVAALVMALWSNNTQPAAGRGELGMAARYQADVVRAAGALRRGVRGRKNAPAHPIDG